MASLAHIALVFGTDTGNTEEVGGKIAKSLRSYGYTVDMMNVTNDFHHAVAIQVFDYGNPHLGLWWHPGRLGRL